MRVPASALLAALVATPLLATGTEALSWGKPGVSIDQYRTDAITCGRAGYYADVSNTEAAHVFKRATRDIEANEAGLSSVAMIAGSGSADSRRAAAMELGDIVNQSAHIAEGTRPRERMDDVRSLMQAQVDDCLKGRGYIRFRLTAAQRKQLARLHLGSPERHIYLYQLATDPNVLKLQAM